MTTANYVPSVTIDQVIDALTTFVQLILPTGQIVRGQQNRVALPPDPCCVLTELLESDLNVPYGDYTPTNQTAILNASTRIDVQVDFYGVLAGNYAKAFKSMFRSEWGWEQFPDTVKPLYTDDGRKMPLITGEQQYESRWTLTASMQYNPTVTVPQQSATAVGPTKINVPVNFT